MPPGLARLVGAAGTEMGGATAVGEPSVGIADTASRPLMPLTGSRLRATSAGFAGWNPRSTPRLWTSLKTISAATGSMPGGGCTAGTGTLPGLVALAS